MTATYLDLKRVFK